MCDDFACFGFDEIRLLSYVLWHFVKWVVLNLDEFEVSVDKHQELDWVIRDYYPLLRSPVDGNKDWIRMCSCNYLAASNEGKNCSREIHLVLHLLICDLGMYGECDYSFPNFVA